MTKDLTLPLKLLKLILLSILIILVMLLTACNDDEGIVENPESNSMLVGEWQGDSFMLFQGISFITSGNLSGSIIFESDGTYNSTLSPLNISSVPSGIWEITGNTILFNKGDSLAMEAQIAILTEEVLNFSVSEGDSVSGVVREFTLNRAE